jgi:hypothetical protein
VAGEAGRVGPIAPQFKVDHFKHAVQVAINVIIPKSQHPEIGTREPGITTQVARLMRRLVVLSAIDFDNEPLAHADKIDDVSFAGRLTAKMESALFP